MSRPEVALTEWRKTHGLSQSAAGELVRPPVSQAAWASWEAGQAPGLHNAFEVERITERLIEASSWSKPHAKQAKKKRAKRSRIEVKAA